MIKTVLFDLDGTIINENQIIKGLRYVYDSHKTIFKNIDYEKFLRVNEESRQEINILQKKGLIKFHQSGVIIWDIFLRKIGIFPKPHITIGLYISLQKYINNHIYVNPGFYELFEYCQKYSIKTGIISNGSISERVDRLKKIKIYSKLDILVSSDIVGYEKPDLRIFKYAIKQLKNTPDEIIYVGNNILTDMKPSKELKIKSFLYLATPVKELSIANNECVNDFSQLIPIIKRFNS